MKRSKRGSSYIVEASLIFPVIVAVTVLLLSAAVYIYGLTSSCSDLNRIVRREAGKRSDTVYYLEEGSPDSRYADISESGVLLSKKVSAGFKKSFTGEVIFKINQKNRYRADAYVISEVQILWNRQAAADAAEALKDQVAESQ